MNREDNRTYITLPPVVPASNNVPDPEPSKSADAKAGYVVLPTHLEPPEVAYTRRLATIGFVLGVAALFQDEIKNEVSAAMDWTEQQNEKI